MLLIGFKRRLGVASTASGLLPVPFLVAFDARSTPFSVLGPLARLPSVGAPPPPAPPPPLGVEGSRGSAVVVISGCSGGTTRDWRGCVVWRAEARTPSASVSPTPGTKGAALARFDFIVEGEGAAVVSDSMASEVLCLSSNTTKMHTEIMLTVV